MPVRCGEAIGYTGLNQYFKPKKDIIFPKNLRLTLDYEEDYWLLDSVRRILGNLTSRDEVDQLLLSNPDMYKINWFRNEEWKTGQLSKKI